MNIFFLIGIFVLQPPAPSPAVPTAKQNPPSAPLMNIQHRVLFNDSPRTKRITEAIEEAKAAHVAVKAGKIKEATATYEALMNEPLLEGSMAYTMALEGLGDIYGEQGREREAIALYRTLVYQKPGQSWLTSRSNDPDLRLKFALLLHKTGQHSEALENFNVGLAGSTKYARTMDARLPMRVGDLIITTQTAPTARFVFAAHMALAACRNNFDKKETLFHLREAIRIRPNYAPAHYYLGSLLHYDDLGKAIRPSPAEATAELQKASDLDGGDVRYWANYWIEAFNRPRPIPVNHPKTTVPATSPALPADKNAVPL